MLNIGCHLSVAKGFLKAAEQVVELGGNTFQFFTRNPRGSKAKALNLEDLAELKIFIDHHNFARL